MGCGCADRARKILPVLGFERDGEEWTDGNLTITDSNLDKHHARETAKALASRLRLIGGTPDEAK